MKKRLKVPIIIVLSILGAIVFYVGTYTHASQSALDAMKSTNQVQINETNKYITYTPLGKIQCGLIFYPGGKIEPSAYSRVFYALATQGIETIVIKMPFNLAMLNINGARKAMQSNPEIENWYLSGHSLGGVFATEYLKDNESDFSGMIYLASYPSKDVTCLATPILSINASNDSVVDADTYEQAKNKLPAETTYYTIEGGNHTQFGDYPLQKGDTVATITYDEQHNQIVKQILLFIKNNN